MVKVYHLLLYIFQKNDWYIVPFSGNVFFLMAIALRPTYRVEGPDPDSKVVTKFAVSFDNKIKVQGDDDRIQACNVIEKAQE